MALIRNCSHTTYTQHETETQTTVVTFNDEGLTNLVDA